MIKFYQILPITEAVTGGALQGKVFLELSQNLQQNICG